METSYEGIEPIRVGTILTGSLSRDMRRYMWESKRGIGDVLKDAIKEYLVKRGYTT